MDFELSDEHKSLRDSVRRFAQIELSDNQFNDDDSKQFSWTAWKKCAEFGILGLPAPSRYGGSEADVLTCALAMESLGCSCRDTGLLFSIGSHLWTCEIPIMLFGSLEQKEKYLPSLCEGSVVGGHAMTEPDAGSDAFSMRTTAVKKGNRYVLNGNKIFISNAPIADLLVVFAITDKTRGFAGISGFIIEKGFPGFSVGKPLDKMGLTSAPTGQVILEDCEVPLENRLGKEGAGSSIFNAEMEWERICLFASHIGAMERLLERTIRYARDRKQFGKPIGQFQAVSHKIAEMKVSLELSKLVLYKAAWLKSKGKRAPLQTAIAKLFVSESYVASSLAAIQIHGAYGYMKEFAIEKHLRDAVAARIYSGTSEIQKNFIASWLGL